MNKKEAVAAASALVKTLGKGWKSVCWNTVDWNYKAISKTGTIQVYPSTIKGEYTAYLGAPGAIAGDGELIGRGKSPQEAVDNAVWKARYRIATLETWLEGRKIAKP